MYSDRIKALISTAENSLTDVYARIEHTALYNQDKVLNAFRKHRIADRHFSQTTGYGYGDIGRDTLNLLFADIMGAEKALVSPHILSGTHALSIALFGILRPGDLLLAISGKPYDTLDDMIHKSGIGSLKDFGIKYSQIDLRDDGFDCEKITEAVSKERPRAVYIQRSKGYDRRTSLTVEAIQDIIKKVRAAGSGAVIMVDNCYGEFVETREPTEVGADIIAGSFIKNPGGGIAPSGGYIAGAAKLIDGIAGRLTVPGVGAEIGSFSGGYASYYQGIFLAPHVVSQAVKGAYLAAAVFRLIGYRARPFIDETLSDIVCSIEFKTSDELLSFCRSIQAFSPVDSHVTPLPWDMPGYAHQVIMAAGTFVQGASIELSCDSPIKEPFTAYLQGGLTYEHIKLALGYAIAELELAD